MIRALAQVSAWVGTHEKVFVLGPTGVGKSIVACALAQKACRDGYSALYRQAEPSNGDSGRFRPNAIVFATFHASVNNSRTTVNCPWLPLAPWPPGPFWPHSCSRRFFLAEEAVGR